MIWLISTGCDALTCLGVEARKTSMKTDYLLNSGLNFGPLGTSETISLLKAFLLLKGVHVCATALLTTMAGFNL